MIFIKGIKSMFAFVYKALVLVHCIQHSTYVCVFTILQRNPILHSDFIQKLHLHLCTWAAQSGNVNGKGNQ